MSSKRWWRVVQDKQGEMLSLIVQVMAETELQLLLQEVSVTYALAAVEVVLVQIPQEVQVRVAQVVAELEQYNTANATAGTANTGGGGGRFGFKAHEPVQWWFWCCDSSLAYC
jgi:hypothetical protein